MAKKKPNKKQIETFIHDEAKRRNIPTAEHESVMHEHDKAPIQLAYERRNRDLDPQLVWRGKDEQDWSDLVVQAPPLYIQEKVHPKVLIDDLVRKTERQDEKDDIRQSLFADLYDAFNGLDEAAKTDFYKHDQNWSNRMILGDSLQVMASLAEREGLRGQVQCIYIDPPYGIKFNSNFQWSTTSRDVKDGNTGHITREPEQVKAFRDTWRDGIHSYLTYLRDRLTVARDLLTESGSIFVQIGDENVHRVRELMDEVLGEENFVSLISYTSTSGIPGNTLARAGDYVIWYARKLDWIKYRQLLELKTHADFGHYNLVYENNEIRRMTKEEREDITNVPSNATLATSQSLTSQGETKSDSEVIVNGKSYKVPAGQHWKTTVPGIYRLYKKGRILVQGNSLRYIRLIDDFGAAPLKNIWTTDTVIGSQEKIYVVQTASEVIKRCILMTTDPGDLVLDPTCGSGTTAYVAEQWGRRWITVYTSRVALALARARIMGARYPYYVLKDEVESERWLVASGGKDIQYKPQATNHPATYHYSLRQGFVYERVPHITLKSIANNTEIDVIWEKWEEQLSVVRGQLSEAIGNLPVRTGSGSERVLDGGIIEEWEVPRERPDHWPQATDHLLQEFWKLRIERQKEIDASIAAKANFEYLYDKPYTDNKKVRVAGPFTVESLSPHRVLGVDENDELMDSGQWSVAGDPKAAGHKSPGTNDFVPMILENLRTAGVQQAHKEDKFTFISGPEPWPGHYVCASGEVVSDKLVAGEKPGHRSQTTNHYRAAVFIGPEFGTVGRGDLVAAAREAGDAGFDVLIACAFNYDALSSEFDKLGRVPVLKARMNADLHMADDLKNTGKGNLFVIFGEPDIEVVSGRWLVTSKGEKLGNYEQYLQLSGFGSLEEINRLGREDISRLKELSAGRAIWPDQPDTSGGGIDPVEYSGGSGTTGNGRISSVSGDGDRITGGGGDTVDIGGKTQDDRGGRNKDAAGSSSGNKPNARWPKTLAAIETLKPSDLPLSLDTDHYTQITVNGVDVFKPQSGEVESVNTDGIACWFIDTDYNGESFFVRHAYFLGQNDPYKSLKTTLKAEINEEAWSTLNSDISRPFRRPDSGRIAVKVINHLGDEVMKVFRV